MENQKHKAFSIQTITKFTNKSKLEKLDHIAVEAPLQMDLQSDIGRQQLAITMRTPGEDQYLAKGYLFSEGIIQSDDQIQQWYQLEENLILIQMVKGFIPNLGQQERASYTSSSCGVCGKTSLDMIRTMPQYTTAENCPKVNVQSLGLLPEKLFNEQLLFTQTGGNHAAALFDEEGQLILSAEDVGRHNALDKLLGKALEQNMIPISNHILLLSGRISFELVQKAAMAGIGLIAAIGAPSSAAIELAQSFNITLIGFLRKNSFNLYAGKHRVFLGEQVVVESRE